MKYPNPCTRCGFCCLAETCTLARISFKIGKHDPCPALVFNGDVATCTLESVPFGDGCCIKARAYHNGIEYDFAGLPAELKINAAESMRRIT